MAGSNKTEDDNDPEFGQSAQAMARRLKNLYGGDDEEQKPDVVNKKKATAFKRAFSAFNAESGK